ncbi:hypothetical protein GOBAR_DD27615 [Gossypium barbadense]|nr:hypothetical protein GOBAR_DD27615 [Gossypium barbadense]
MLGGGIGIKGPHNSTPLIMGMCLRTDSKFHDKLLFLRHLQAGHLALEDKVVMGRHLHCLNAYPTTGANRLPSNGFSHTESGTTTISKRF